tara:strand:+ start:337 stop:570 length:234 start_codon:yes stop_codon:yes gene_type:complete
MKGKGFVIPTTRFSKRITKYRNLPSYEFFKITALDASDNGRCWWIYQFMMSNTQQSVNEKKEYYGKKAIKENYCKET